MKNKMLLISAALVIALAAGCGNQGAGKTETTAAPTTAAPTTAAPTTEAPTTAAETTAAETKEAEKETKEEIVPPVPSGRSSGLAKDHVQITDSEGCDTFTQIVDKLKDGQGYANATLDGTDVLLVAESTFNGGEEKEAATDAEIFMYQDGKPVYLGCVMTGGTANPLMIKDGKLYSAGHHYVGKFTVEDGKLVIVEEVREKFDSAGNATYQYGSDDGKDHSAIDSDKAKEIYETLMGEYMEADLVTFINEKK